MSFPNADFCIVCESVRPEIGGKVQLLGFYGLAPHVEILVANMAQALAVSFLVGFPAVPAQDTNRLHEHFFIVTDPNGKVLIQTPSVPLNVEAGKRVQIAMGYIMPPTVAGKHVLKVLVDNEAKLETTFVIRIATSAELAKAGISPAQ